MTSRENPVSYLVSSSDYYEHHRVYLIGKYCQDGKRGGAGPTAG